MAKLSPRWRKLMFDWMMPIYKAVGVGHPKLSLVVMCFIGAFVFGGWWWVTGREYNERIQEKTHQPVERYPSTDVVTVEKETREQRVERLSAKLRQSIVADMASQMGLVCEPAMMKYLAGETFSQDDFNFIVANLEDKGFLKRQPGFKQDGRCWMVH